MWVEVELIRGGKVLEDAGGARLVGPAAEEEEEEEEEKKEDEEVEFEAVPLLTYTVRSFPPACRFASVVSATVPPQISLASPGQGVLQLPSGTSTISVALKVSEQ
jgi:hypothetical protein